MSAGKTRVRECLHSRTQDTWTCVRECREDKSLYPTKLGHVSTTKTPISFADTIACVRVTHEHKQNGGPSDVDARAHGITLRLNEVTA